jgi:adenylate cyclase
MSSGLKKQSILIVDDAPENINVLADALKSDYKICLAINGPKALKIAGSENPPDLILLDIMMPGMDGYEVCRKLKSDRKTKNIPIIFITARTEEEDETKGFDIGAVDYIAKPFSPAIVKARVRTHLELEKRTRELKNALKDLDLRNQFIRQAFGRYLSDEVVSSILETPEGLNLGGEIREVTIMMSDIRGFTALSERRSAQDVVGIINIYLEVMIEIILKYQGTINEIIGDGILAIFGAPVLRDDDAKRAAACAVEMQLAMEEVNERNQQKGYPKLGMGIGINTGKLVVGNIGSKKRVKYGVVGSNVNLTSRIVSYTVGDQIFISEDTAAACGPILRIDDRLSVMPKGLKKPLTICELGGIGGDFNVYLPEKQEVKLTSLHRSLPVKLTILVGKHADKDMIEGNVMKLSPDMAEIRANIGVERLADLKISLFDDTGTEMKSDLYAKVIKNLSEYPPVFRVKFTSVSDEIARFIDEWLGV